MVSDQSEFFSDFSIFFNSTRPLIKTLNIWDRNSRLVVDGKFRFERVKEQAGDCVP